MARSVEYRLQRYGKCLSLGAMPSLVYIVQGLRKKFAKPRQSYALYSKDALYPVLCRPNTSDLDVFDQIFVGREYRCLDDAADVGLIIDCGANVGYSSAYFLSRFGQARIIAIEPDLQNYALLQQNLAPYGNRVDAICSAVWSRPAGLVRSEETAGSGKEWGRTVREARPGETPMMKATDIGTLLAGSGYDHISILKVDIEGAEAAVFAEHFEPWIDKVDNLVIELHSDECRSTFMAAIAGRGFSLSECDELTVCKRLP
ncbi:MAG: FkbM family methyltransferase [Hydrogenophilaceae bacterium]|nr:FkbM family methyltransferase [Hydrogenophilaceae bacterium]